LIAEIALFLLWVEMNLNELFDVGGINPVHWLKIFDNIYRGGLAERE
jgi:hypothetical protein